MFSHQVIELVINTWPKFPPTVTEVTIHSPRQQVKVKDAINVALELPLLSPLFIPSRRIPRLLLPDCTHPRPWPQP